MTAFFLVTPLSCSGILSYMSHPHMLCWGQLAMLQYEQNFMAGGKMSEQGGAASHSHSIIFTGHIIILFYIIFS